ncbi:MAG: hypothetical protein ACPG5U_01775 [Planktomarina sp.]
MLKAALHLTLVILLTLLTQLGGIAWLIALMFRRRFIVFIVAYIGLSVLTLFVAPLAGRVPLPCVSGDTMTVRSPIYCAMNRQYVTAEMREVLQDFAGKIQERHPDTQTLILDANFPFITGFPLLPHLSHDDGMKVDLAFYYQRDGSYVRGETRSPIGYFAFEDGPTDCPDNRLTLRWDLAWLQPFWPDLSLDRDRMVSAFDLLSNDPRVTKAFVEPHLKTRFGLTAPKIRFQGCRAARHDDHIHIQL